MTGPKGNSEFCSPESLSVSRGEAKGNIKGEWMGDFFLHSCAQLSSPFFSFFTLFAAKGY